MRLSATTLCLFLLLILVASVAAQPANNNVTESLRRFGLGTLEAAAYSPDGRFIATAGGGGAFLWDVETAEVVREFTGHTGSVSSLAFSPDGTRLLTGEGGYYGDDTARLWDLSTGAVLQTFTGHTNGLTSVAFSSDGSRVLTGSWDHTARLWETSTGAVLQIFPEPIDTSLVYSVALSPDGTRVLTGSNDNTARLWDANTGTVLQTFGHSSDVSCVAFSPDGTRVLTGSNTDHPDYLAVAKLWDANTGALLRTFTGPIGSVESVAFSPDGTRVLTGSADKTARVWEAGTGAVLQTFTGHTDDVLSVAFSSDGTSVLTGSNDNTARLWDTNTGVALRTFTGHTDNVYSVAFSPDGASVLTGPSDGTARLWDASTGSVLQTFTGSTFSVESVAFSPEGTRVLTASGGSNGTRLWDVNAGTVLRTFAGSGVRSVAFSPDGTRVLTGSGDRRAQIWDANTSALLRTFTGHSSDVYSVAFSPDGTRVLTGSGDNTARLWDASTGAVLRTFTGHTGFVNSVAFSPDGTRVLTGSRDKTARLWDATTGPLLRSFTHTSDVKSVAFSPDGTRILTGSGDNTARLWDASTGTMERTFSGHTFGVYSVALSPDGTRVLTGSSDGTALAWELSPPRAIIVAGGGPYAGNSIARQTNDLGVYTYRTLRARGYSPENILYLSAFPNGTAMAGGDPVAWDIDGDGLDDVDGPASREALDDALSGPFGREAGRLMILMMDHGYRTSGLVAFRLSETDAVTTTELNGWLDAMQTAAPVDVTLVVDCCYSGQFAVDCAKTPAIPAARERLVIASTTPSTEAVFLPAPDLTSFMHTFLSSAYMGNSMGEAFRSGARFFDYFPVAGQEPRLHDGTQLHTQASLFESAANKQFFGASWNYGTQSEKNINDFFPAFGSVEPTGTVAPGQPVTLRATTLPFQNPERITVAILPPAPTVLAGDPVAGLPRVELARVGGSTQAGWVWEATVAPGDANFPFAEEGPYRATFTARFGSDRVSDPARTQFTVTSGPDPDAAAIRAVLAFGDGDMTSAPALVASADFAHGIFLDRFQSADGIHRPEWITLHTNLGTTAARVPLTKAALLASIQTRGAEAERLYVHLAGADAGGGVLGLTPSDALTAAELDAALDAVQTSGCEVVLVIDAAGSGSFLTACSPTTGQSRLVLTSTAANECGLFLADPQVTYTDKLMGPLWSGETYEAAHTAASDFFTNFVGQYAGTRLKPQIEDGVDGALARSRWLGRRYAFAGDEASGLPFVVQAEVLPPAAPGQRPRLRAQLMEGIEPVNDGGPDPLDGYRVYARVTPQGLVCGTGATELPLMRLRRDAADAWTWSAPVSELIEPGYYPVTFVAEYPDGTDASRETVPVFRTLDLGTPTGSDPDAYEPADNAAATGTFLPANDLAQDHTLHKVEDQDWYRLLLNGRSTAGIIEPIPYTLRFTNVVLPAGTSLQVSIALDGVATTLPAPGDCVSSEDTLCATITTASREIVVLTDGVQAAQPVLVRVALLGTPSDPDAPVSYDIDLYRGTGANNGIVASVGTTGGSRLRLSHPGAAGYIVLDAGGSFVFGRPSSWSDIQAVRLSRYILRNDDIFSGPTPVGEWLTSRAPYESCEAFSPPNSFEPAVLFEDTTLAATVEEGDLVAYFVSVVIDGAEIPADMFVQPAAAVFVPGLPPSIPSCIAPPVPALEVTPLSVSRSAVAGQPIPSAGLQVKNLGTDPLSWSAQSSAPWLLVGTASGSVGAGSTQPVTLSFNHSGLAPAVTPYTATVTFAVAGSPPAIVNVTLTLTLTAHGSHWTVY